MLSSGFSPTNLSRCERILIGISSLYIFVNAVAFSIASDGILRWRHVSGPIAWLCLLVTVHWALSRLLPDHDPFLIPAVGLLSGWGLLLQDRLAPPFLHRQVAWLALGFLLMTIVATLPRSMRFFRNFRYTWLTLGLLLLAATLFFGVNPSGQGARLWLPIPLIRNVFFQPSELLKLILIIYLASYFDERTRTKTANSTSRPSLLAHLGPLTLMWGFSILLLIWQRDLGAAGLFFIVFVTLLYLATGRWHYLVVGGLLVVVVGAIGYLAFDVVSLRIDSWWNPWPDATGRGFQIVQSIYAIASGGVLGQGIGQGLPTFVPVVHSDFVFSAIGEEWGLIGALGMLAVYCLLTLRSFRIASAATEPFYLYLATGIGVVIGAQSILILGGVTKALPLTGVTLVFVSYGGSSLLVSAIMVGLLLNLSSSQINR